MSAAQAMLFLGTLRERLAIVALDAGEYVSGLERFASLGIVGGTIYDAMLAAYALKADGRDDLPLESATLSPMWSRDIAMRMRTP